MKGSLALLAAVALVLALTGRVYSDERHTVSLGIHTYSSEQEVSSSEQEVSGDTEEALPKTPSSESARQVSADDNDKAAPETPSPERVRQASADESDRPASEASSPAWRQKEDPTDKGDTDVLNGTHETLNVRVTSWRDLPFQTVKRQSFDYSCGSAALATLLAYVYGQKASEQDVFKEMFDSGDKNRIRREGFSLLDMRNYLVRRGYNAAGFKLGMKAIEKYKVPFIALITRDGYSHFVVVKSAAGPVVLVGDPSRGNIVLPKEEFAAMWNGISLVVTNHALQARGLFGDPKEWRFAHAFGAPSLGEHPDIDSVSLPFPNWQIAPTNVNLIGAATAATGGLIP
jgi:uncharacterized protein